jgi:hypothetical protein
MRRVAELGSLGGFAHHATKRMAQIMNYTRQLRFGMALLALAAVPLVSAVPPSTNRPPNVHIVRPADGESFPAGSNIQLGANAPDEGRVLMLEFFANENKIGDARGPLTTPMGAWLLTWTNPPANTYLVTARATDDHGNVATSPPVQVTVRSGPRVPPPRLGITGMSSGGARLFIQGQAGRTNVIEASSDLVTWVGVSTNVMDYSLCPICPFAIFEDSASTNLTRRFYRAFELP